MKNELYQTKSGWQLHPIYDWTFNDINTYFKMYDIQIPWIYDTEFGKHEGTAAFYSLKSDDAGSYDRAWKIVTALDHNFTKERFVKDVK